MNVLVGLFGVLGFLMLEAYTRLNDLKDGGAASLSLLRIPNYYILMIFLSICVALITSLFCINDMSTRIFPPTLQNPTVFEAIRAVVVGMVVLRSLKSGKSNEIMSMTVETTTVRAVPLDLRRTFSIWKAA